MVFKDFRNYVKISYILFTSLGIMSSKSVWINRDCGQVCGCMCVHWGYNLMESFLCHNKLYDICINKQASKPKNILKEEGFQI